MSHHDFERNYNDGYKQGLQSDYGSSAFSPLIIGAVAVLIALGAFLLFSDSSGTNQQAEFNTNPPAASTPAPSAPAEKGPSVIPSTPPASEQPKAQ